MTSLNTRIGAALVVGAMVAVGVWQWRQRTVPPPVAARLEPGVYSVAYDFSIEVPTANGSVKGHAKADARIEVREGMIDGSTRWLAARAVETKLVVDDVARALTDFPADAATREFPQSWMVSLSDDGHVEQAVFSNTLSAGTRAVLTGVASTTQYVRPVGLQSMTWDADEFDLNGPYRAQYFAQADGSVLKSWRMGAGGRGAAEEAELLGDASVRFEFVGSRFRTVTMSQQGSALAGRGDKNERSLFTLSIRIARLGDVSGDDAWAKSLRPEMLQPLDPDNAEAVMPPEPVARPLSDVLAEVREVKGKPSQAEHSALRADLTRAIAASDNAADRVESELRKKQPNEAIENLLIEGLVSAMTDAAQRSVIRLIADERVRRATQVGLLQASSLMSHPNDAFIASATGIVRDHKDRSYAAEVAMMLGAASVQVGQGTPKAQAMAASLVEMGKAPLDPNVLKGKRMPAGVRMNWVRALGNTGDASTRPLIVATLDDPDELVRAAAAESLRFLDPVTVADVMDRQMAKETSIHVRYGLVYAARYMGPAEMEKFVTKALLSDESEYVRLGAAYVIAAWMLDAPRLRQVLSDALAREASVKVRDSLQNYLRPGRVGDGVAATPVRSKP